MPNWTSNTLRFYGSPSSLQAIRDLLAGPNGVIDFNKVVPMPAILERTISPTRLGPNGLPLLRRSADDHSGEEASAQEYVELHSLAHDNWYDWCCANWGTKWNACDPEVAPRSDEGDDHTLSYRFNTAWSAPCGFYDALLDLLARDYPHIEAHASAVHEGEVVKEDLF